MANCPICNANNPDGAIACASCGSPLVGDGVEGAYTLRPGTMLGGGRFSVGKVLGQGGFGITYLGSNIENRQAVAIKEFFLQGCVRQGATVRTTGSITPQSFETIKQRFLDESKLLGQFRHPGIVRVLATLEENGTAYMVMDYLKGRTLKQILETEGVVPEREAVAYAVKVAEALEEIHKAGVLHRDIKPENIIVTEDGRVVLIDFGLARQFAAGQTKMMTSWLTPGYAPIEQYGQKGQFGATTDIYSLGATLYHLLTGQMPDLATDRIMDDKLKSPHELNPQISKSASDAVMSALQMDPGNRPQSANEFIQALGGFGTAVVPPQIHTQDIYYSTAQMTSVQSSLSQIKSPSKFRKDTLLPILLIAFGIAVIVAILGYNHFSNSQGNGNNDVQAAQQSISQDPSPSGSSRLYQGGIPNNQVSNVETVDEFLTRWIDSIKNEDIDAHMECYAPVLENYYNDSDVPADVVRRARAGAFNSFSTMNVNISNKSYQQISPDRVIVDYDKDWDFEDGKAFKGSERAELILVRYGSKWKIVSETEIKVYWVDK